jgi:putative addiction module CopG family antidote
MNYTINVTLPKALAEKTKKQVKSGYYSSTSEVIREALRCLFNRDAAIPTFKMSPKAEKLALQVLKDHKAGKTIRLKNIDDLDKYL